MPAPSAATASASSAPRSSRRRSSGRCASGKPAILHCLIDPEAITPTTTLTAIREKALAAQEG